VFHKGKYRRMRGCVAAASTLVRAFPSIAIVTRAAGYIVTDGELRRDNMVDYFVERLPWRADRPVVEEVLLRLLRWRGV
jgi:hypothetical protein